MDDQLAATSADMVHCGSCGGDLDGAILMTCMHALCRACAPNPSSFTSGGRRGSEPLFVCPVCSPASASQPTSQNGVTSAGQNANVKAAACSRIAAQPCVSIRELRRLKNNEVSGINNWDEDDDDDDDDDGDEGENGDVRNGTNGNGGDGGGGGITETFVTSLIFPCPQHAHRDSEQFCLQCHTLACSKCVTTNHRKCDKHLVTCAEAVVAQRPLLNSLHSRIAQKLMTAQDSVKHHSERLEDIEQQRKALIGQIRAQKEALVRALAAKEEQLIGEVNATLERERARVEGRADESKVAARSAEGQLSVLEAVLSVKGEPEILSLLPSLHTSLEAEKNDSACANSATSSTRLVFTPNATLEADILKSNLGQISVADEVIKVDVKKLEDDVTLSLMTSFNARTREDTCEPLLTDLILLQTGDVILTDRDNKCVKKFNSTGHLLTRVPIPEVPSRIALVSHGKAVISVMNRKVLLFMSLLGTIRVLSKVKVKKPYCFLATAGYVLDPSQGQGQDQGPAQLLAATNQCDVIDLISENGQLLRRLYTYKGEKVNLSRPLYLHVPYAQGSEGVSAALVVDSGRRVLFGLTSDGQTTFTFRPKTDPEQVLECPLGVASIPSSGLIFLADRDKNRILLLGRRGTYLRQALGEGEGLHKPCALFASIPHRLALTQVDGWVKIYKLE